MRSLPRTPKRRPTAAAIVGVFPGMDECRYRARLRRVTLVPDLRPVSASDNAKGQCEATLLLREASMPLLQRMQRQRHPRKEDDTKREERKPLLMAARCRLSDGHFDWILARGAARGETSPTSIHPNPSLNAAGRFNNTTVAVPPGGHEQGRNDRRTRPGGLSPSGSITRIGA